MHLCNVPWLFKRRKWICFHLKGQWGYNSSEHQITGKNIFRNSKHLKIETLSTKRYTFNRLRKSFGVKTCLRPKFESHRTVRRTTKEDRCCQKWCGQRWKTKARACRAATRASVCWFACISFFLFLFSPFKNRWFLVLNGSCVNSVGSWSVAPVQRQHGYQGGVLGEVQFAFFRCAAKGTEGREVLRTVAPSFSR